MNIVIATIKEINIKNSYKLKKNNCKINKITILTQKDDLTFELIENIKPDYIFFPHWSWIIPSSIYKNYNCVVFHMTDLPYGRGGSPLQNLIVKGIKETKISAIKVEKEIDAGDIYLKENLNLNGTADEILIRASNIIFEKMIPRFLVEKLDARSQSGHTVEFIRRNNHESEIKEDFNLEKIYDYIRMLDGEGYPNAYITFGKYKLYFSRASFKYGKIVADVEIREEE